MDRKPFETLARLVQTLAVGRQITLPFVMGARETEWKETFLVGRDRVNGGDAVLHGMTTRRHGVETRQADEVCDWGLDAVLQQINEWDDDTFISVEAQLIDIERCGHTVQAIADLADGPGSVAMLGGSVWRRPGDDAKMVKKGDPKWSLDQAVMAVRAGR